MVDCSDLDYGQFNLIAAACGAGKTYWIINHFLKHAETQNIRPAEILFVTSRSIIKEQQSKTKGTTKLRRNDSKIVDYWNGLYDDESMLEDYGIMLATYDQLIDMVKNGVGEGREVLSNVKVIVLDECHAMFSDEFMEDIATVRVWIREVVNTKCRLFIGLSATTKIIETYSASWGVLLNRINKESVIGYQAEQLICTDFYTIPYLISSNKLIGKTIIMCPSIKHCYELSERIANSTVVVSVHARDHFTDEMGRIRDYIAKESSLPPTYFDDDKKEHELHVLICTSTLREGFNLNEDSGVRNVVTCLTDELHVTQFLGRCRYNVDCLVIAKTFLHVDNVHPNDYLSKSRKLFNDYLDNKVCATWFNTVSHLVKHGVYGSKKFILGTDDVRFLSYIDKRWLVPKGTQKGDTYKYRIWREEDKNEIVDMAISCKMFALWPSRVTFIRVIKMLQETFEYDIKKRDTTIDGERQRYRIILGRGVPEIPYEPAIPTIDE